MPAFAGWTEKVGAHERNVLVAVGLEVARLTTTLDKQATTVRTDWALNHRIRLPLRGTALECEVGKHTCAHRVPALVKCVFDFT